MITDSPKQRAIDRGVPRELIVRLQHRSREPSTPVERLALATLRREGPTPLHVLVKRVDSAVLRVSFRAIQRRPWREPWLDSIGVSQLAMLEEARHEGTWASEVENFQIHSVKETAGDSSSKSSQISLGR